MVRPSFGQLALDRLPSDQNTTCWSACSEAMYCNSASSAWNRKTSAMPSRTIVSAVTPRIMLKAKMISAASIAKMKALPATKKSPSANGTRLTPSTSAMAAPKLAAAEIPSVNGLASGLLRIVCISAPAMASDTPTTTAISAIGRRISQTMA